MKKLLLASMLLFSVAFSLTIEDLNDLLYPEETNSSITYYNFTLDGSNYSLVYVDGKPSLFFKDGVLVELRSEIRGPLWENYSNTYYPENLSAKLEEMRALIDSFNESRFDGIGKEEYGCRIALGEPYAASFNPSLFSSIYEYYATVICTDAIGEELNCKDASDLLPGIEGFFTPSYDLDAKVELVRANLNISDAKDIYPNMVEILEAIDAMEEDVQQIKQNEFRYPLNDVTGEPDLDECPNCKPLCYELIHNQTALDNLRALAQELADISEPLFRFDAIVEEVYTSTQERLDYKENYDSRVAYENELSSVLKGWDALKNRTTAVLERVDDPSLASYLNVVEEARQDAEEALEENNFTVAEQKLNILKNTVSLISQKTSNYEEILSQIDDAVRKIEALNLSVRKGIFDSSSALDEELGSALANLSKKMNESELEALLEKVNRLETEYLKMSKNQRSSVIASTFKGLQRYHEAYYSLIAPLLPSASMRLEFLRLTPILLSVVVGLTFASLVVWLTVPKFYATKEHRRQLTRSRKGFFFLLTGIGAFFMFVMITVASFFAYDEAVNRATLLSFAESLQNYNSLNILVKSPSSAILSCAEDVKSKLKDKEVTIFQSYDSTCKVNGELAKKSDCDVLDFPMLVLEEGSPVEISGSSLGDLYLLVKMPSSSYERCIISSALELSQPPSYVEPDTSSEEQPANDTGTNTTNETNTTNLTLEG